MIDPDACQTMLDVRTGVDEMDRQIVSLLGKRMRFIEAAARLKAARADVRDEERKAAVIGQACAVAREVSFPPDLVRDLYEVLVEGSIEYELAYFDRL